MIRTIYEFLQFFLIYVLCGCSGFIVSLWSVWCWLGWVS